MIRVFLTGGSSAIGQCVLANLTARGCSVTALVHRQPLPGHPSLQTVSGSIGAPESYSRAAGDAGVIIHLAGLSHSHTAAQYHDVNTRGTERLLGTCPPRSFFLYLSTRCAHPDGGDYAVSKLRAEQAILSSGLNYSLIRPAEVYGTKAEEGIERLLQFSLRYRLVPDFRQHGSSVTYAPVGHDEVADFLVKVALSPCRDRSVYTLCAERSWTARDLCRELSRIHRRRYHLLPIPVAWLKQLVKLHLPVPFKRDQLARLTAPKSDDLSAAGRDYAFHPRPFAEYLQRSSPMKGRSA
jgi:nucleoside-diphosphate-sugar epimerase